MDIKGLEAYFHVEVGSVVAPGSIICRRFPTQTRLLNAYLGPHGYVHAAVLGVAIYTFSEVEVVPFQIYALDVEKHKQKIARCAAIIEKGLPDLETFTTERVLPAAATPGHHLSEEKLTSLVSQLAEHIESTSMSTHGEPVMKKDADAPEKSPGHPEKTTAAAVTATFETYNLVPSPNMVVVGRVISVTASHAYVSLLLSYTNVQDIIDSHNEKDFQSDSGNDEYITVKNTKILFNKNSVPTPFLSNRHRAILRSTDVRLSEIDTVDMHKMYKAGDLITAVILSLGNTNDSIVLTTAASELGVISAACDKCRPLYNYTAEVFASELAADPLAGQLVDGADSLAEDCVFVDYLFKPSDLEAIDWQQMQCKKCLSLHPRKVAKPHFT